MTKEEHALTTILAQRELNEFFRLHRHNIHFSHYTTAAAAMLIIKNKDIWMRNAAIMNDRSEIKYGEEFLSICWKDEEIKKLIQGTFDAINESIYDQISELIEKYRERRINQTFITSISEHSSPEDERGRLSMWRAYGGNDSVALVFNRQSINDLVKKDLTVLPVLYVHLHEFKLFIKRLISEINENVDKFKNIKPEVFINMIWTYLQFIILSTKDPGFKEEREWRIIHSRVYVNSHLKESVEIINGVPQVIFKLNMKYMLLESQKSNPISNVIEKIIIGPTNNSNILCDAFYAEIKNIYPSDAKSKIIQSDIPLRR